MKAQTPIRKARPELAATMEHSRQAVLAEPGRLEMRDVTMPHPGPGEVLLQIKCALSCGTDLKAYRRGHPMWRLPTPFGHEFAGIVAEVGPDVENFRPGDALMAAPTAPCDKCFYCGRGQENLCAQAMEKMVLGGYADYLLLGSHVVARNAFRKPADLPFEEAALLEPLACVVHAQEGARPETFESVVIIGAGPFGLLHMLALRARGVREIVVAGRGAQRLEWAGQLGADRVGWADALARVRRGGRVVFFGGCPVNTTLTVDTRRMHYDNLTLLAPFHFRPCDVRRAFELLCERKLGAGRIVNARRPLSELAEVFAMLERGAVLKCAVIP